MRRAGDAIRVRPARRADAAAIARLANDLNRFEGCATAPFTARGVLRDGFGPSRVFTPLVAIQDGAVIGCLLYLDGYDTDRGRPAYWVEVIYVKAALRRDGVGRALLAALAKVARQRGRVSLGFGIRAVNAPVTTFYEKLGAKPEGTAIHVIEGKALTRLAHGRE